MIVPLREPVVVWASAGQLISATRTNASDATRASGPLLLKFITSLLLGKGGCFGAGNSTVRVVTDKKKRPSDKMSDGLLSKALESRELRPGRLLLTSLVGLVLKLFRLL